MKLAALAALLLLAACGAEAPPRHDAPQPGPSVSGEARIGVRGTL
ncbi:MAG: hypothetical protein ACK4HW_07095 [Roseinatronobacter sp.]